MSDRYITLLGSEDVARAASTMQSAGDDMRRSADTFQSAVELHNRSMEDFAIRLGDAAQGLDASRRLDLQEIQVTCRMQHDIAKFGEFQCDYNGWLNDIAKERAQLKATT